MFYKINYKFCNEGEDYTAYQAHHLARATHRYRLTRREMDQNARDPHVEVHMVSVSITSHDEDDQLIATHEGYELQCAHQSPI